MLARVITLALALVMGGCGGVAKPSPTSATTARIAKAHLPCPPDDTSRVIALVNQARRRARLRMLGNDQHLARFATSRSAAMASDRRLSHAGWEQALRRYGLTDDILGENVAYNYDTPEEVMSGWLKSSGHRANILRPAFKRIGVGCVIDPRGHRWWTQDFAG